MISHTRLPSIAILGAGIAGCLTAHELRLKGANVTLMDSAECIAAGASGNLAGLVRNQPTPDDVAKSMAVEFTDAAAAFALAYYAALCDEFGIDAWQPISLVHMPQQAAHVKQWSNTTDPRWQSAEALSKVVGLRCTSNGLIDPDVALLQPQLLCEALVAGVSKGPIELQLSRRVELHDLESFDAVVIATGAATRSVVPSLPVQPLRGQISFVAADSTLNHAVSGAGYVAPLVFGGTSTGVGAQFIAPGDFATKKTGTTLVFGATYERNRSDVVVHDDAHLANIESVRQLLPELGESLAKRFATAPSSFSGRASFRATTADRLPICGRLADSSKRLVLTGLGSRGLTWAPILARHIACLITGEDSPLDDHFVEAVSPGRFVC